MLGTIMGVGPKDLHHAQFSPDTPPTRLGVVSMQTGSMMTSMMMMRIETTNVSELIAFMKQKFYTEILKAFKINDS